MIEKLVMLRIERARLMGVGSHAEFVLADSMAKTPSAALDLLMSVYRPALARSKEELHSIEKLAAKNGVSKVEPWDWRYYAEQVRRERFSLDELAVKRYIRSTAF